MKIKIGTVYEDVTAYGNRYWIQIEDNAQTSNHDVKELVGKQVTIVIGEINAVDNFLAEVSIL